MDGCPGLRLVATASRKTWTYRYKSPVTGQMKQTKIGEWPAMSPTQAGAAWEALKGQRADGVDLKALKREKLLAARAVAGPEVYTVRKLVRDYIDGHIKASRKDAGALAAERALDRLLDDDPQFAERTPASIPVASASTSLRREKLRQRPPKSYARSSGRLGSTAWMRGGSATACRTGGAV